MSRRVIQIAIHPETEVAIEHCFALCDDGSIWALPRPGSNDPGANKWRRLPDVPGGGDETIEARLSEDSIEIIERVAERILEKYSASQSQTKALANEIENTVELFLENNGSKF